MTIPYNGTSSADLFDFEVRIDGEGWWEEQGEEGMWRIELIK